MSDSFFEGIISLAILVASAIVFAASFGAIFGFSIISIFAYNMIKTIFFPFLGLAIITALLALYVFLWAFRNVVENESIIFNYTLAIVGLFLLILGFLALLSIEVTNIAGIIAGLIVMALGATLIATGLEIEQFRIASDILIETTEKIPYPKLR